MIISIFLISLITSSLISADKNDISINKFNQYNQIAKLNNGIINLNSISYDDLTDGPRNFSISVVLTAIPNQYNCAPCLAFAPEHAIVAKTWSKQPESNMHLFAVLDFSEGAAIFKRLGLTTAPKIQLFKPNIGPRAVKSSAPEDAGRGGFTAEGFSDHLKSAADIPLRFSRPIDKVKALTTGLTLVGIIVLITFAWPMVSALVSNKYIWAVASIVVILLMIGGYMWNQIRLPQYSEVRDGQINYIAAGYSNQFGAETHLLAVLYGLLAFAAYTLAFTVPNLSDPFRQRLGVYVWTGISVVLLGLLTSIFSNKQGGGYPFRFMF